MPAASQSFLRQRAIPESARKTPPLVQDDNDDHERTPRASPEPIVWGKTPSGEMFRVPTTHDVLTALFHPKYPKSHFDILNLGLLALQIVLFFALSRTQSRIFFALYFTFWRSAYDAGLGWVLTKQSKKKWIVREVQRLGWLDSSRRPLAREWIRKQLVGKMGDDYSFDELPLEYNTWLLFRQVVDVILINDFLAYCMFAFSCFRIPEGLPMWVHALRWVGGAFLIAFNLWVKTEAHNVVKDYGWYWGDVFFQRGALIFDGVFELAPHPMYSVGYAGYYGLSIIVGSYAVLLVSLAAHAAQFAFLVFFENPHIERMYGQKKLIAKRTPLFPSTTRTGPSSTIPLPQEDPATELSTPGATDGETATESDLETETETEGEGEALTDALRFTRHRRALSTADSMSSSHTTNHAQKKKGVSQHDLINKYFRRDTLILKNIDLFRANDAMLLLVISYALTLSFMPTLGYKATLALHTTHSVLWVFLHTFGLGLVLRAQSENRYLVRHFVNNYYYGPSGGDAAQGAIADAFGNWKALYNMSLCMTYVSFMGIVWKTYSFPTDWAVGHELLRHIVGVLLVGLHMWASKESYEVLGAFGWFFGDFFVDEIPTHLEYSGIYRYINNPEIMGGAAWFGLGLISGSKIVYALAGIRTVCHWWFLSSVEHPHMHKLYGDSLRKEAGFVKVIKNVASKNAKILESRAGKHGPEIKRVAKEVKGTFDKVFEETADVVEEFLAKSRPRLSEVMQETKVLLQQSRERLVITRVTSDLSQLDLTKYKLTLAPSAQGNKRFHLGEPITLRWTAPATHSSKDWIGLYRVGANKSPLVTKVASMGYWAPVYDEEWDGDEPLGLERSRISEEGVVVFKGDTLPWVVGQFEARYHHDGKYNVMSLDGPLEIYVDRVDTFDIPAIREALYHIVSLCLDSDPALIPLACQAPSTPRPDNSPHPDGYERDPDDFAFWSEEQARRICGGIKEAFGVEYSAGVILAEANVSSLAQRILVSKEMMGQR